MLAPTGSYGLEGTYQYLNVNYGYVVYVPSDLTIETNTPPAPNHGFKITLGDRRTVTVDASYDVLNFGSLSAALRNRAEQAEISDHKSAFTLQLNNTDAAGIGDAQDSRDVEVIVAYRHISNSTSIIYTFELDTNEMYWLRDHKVFRKIVDGFFETPY